tara:strand:+ start:726 stop:902 length:177 start_codon:yes stop_codon:yes gene_type:complete
MILFLSLIFAMNIEQYQWKKRLLLLNGTAPSAAEQIAKFSKQQNENQERQLLLCYACA